MNNREQFLKEGSELIKSEIQTQANYVIDVQKNLSLRNIEILSTNIIANKNVHKTIKNHVAEYSSNIQKMLLGTAHFIQKEKFQSVDETIKNLSLSKFDQNRLESLFLSQKKFHFSFETLSVVTEIFKRVNQNILDEIEKSKSTDTISKLEKTSLYLKNAIVVYELTNFVVKFLESFKLEGIQDIIAIQEEVYSELKKNKLRDEKLREQAIKNKDEKLRESTLRDVDNRESVRQRVKEKWEKMLNDLGEYDTKVEHARGYIENIKIIRDNAQNQIDIINILATTQVVQSSLDVIGGLADITNFEIAPLNEKTACELLNIEI